MAELTGEIGSSPGLKLELPKEFGEIPRGFVSVFTQVRKEDLPYITEEGLEIDANKMASVNPDLEAVFEEVAQKKGIGFSRTACIFAYPRRKGTTRLHFDQKRDLLLEIKIDPSKALVVDADLYTSAEQRYRLDKLTQSGGWESIARDRAEYYWGGAKILKQYLAEGHIGEKGDFKDFEFPEVLISDNVPLSRIKKA